MKLRDFKSGVKIGNRVIILDNGIRSDLVGETGIVRGMDEEPPIYYHIDVNGKHPFLRDEIRLI